MHLSITEGTNAFSNLIPLAERDEFNSIKDTYPGLYIRNKRTLESLFRYDSKHLINVCGLWLFGPHRTGEDFSIYSLFVTVYVIKILQEIWLNGYLNQMYLLLSDVEPCHSSRLRYFLKIWIDRYPFLAEVKGSTMRIRPKNIIVISNFKIDQIWTGSVFVATNSRFYNIYMDDIDSPNVYKCMSSEPNHQYFNVLNTWNFYLHACSTDFEEYTDVI